jgi:IgGFc binding protein
MKVTHHRPRPVIGPLVPLLLLALGCGSSSADSGFGAAGSGGSGGGSGGTGGSSADGGQDAGCSEGDILCDGTVQWRCDATGGREDPVNCANDDLICVDGLGCAVCVPGSTSCTDGIGTFCTEDGAHDESFACDPMQGLACNPDGCVGACTPQRLGRSHIGCEFWPTVTANSAWGAWFPFGVMVVNTTDEAAAVIVTRGDETIVERSLAPGGMEAIELPWIDDLKGPDADEWGTVIPPTTSVLSKSVDGGGAYRLRSDRPVVVTQFSTMRSNDPDGVANGCPPDPYTGECLSSSNDASLLMPTHALESTHVLMGWHAWRMEPNQNEPGVLGDFVSITAVNDETAVVVTPAFATLPVDNEPPLEPGGPAKFTLERGDVLQLFTNADVAGAQWAGAEVSADQPVQVLTGAPCVNVPDATPTCDHIEESNLPLNMLGKRYMVMAPVAPSGRTRQIVRIHGIEDETLIEFDPSTVHKSITVNQGEVVELDLLKDASDETSPDFLVSSAKRFGVTQYMVGNQADPYDPYATGADLGDPSQTFVVPTSRYLKRYVIALPPGFDEHQVAIMAATGAEVFVDDEAVPSTELRAIGASGLSVARLGALNPSERHELRSDKPFGVQVYGFGKFTSYMVPGGIDLRAASQ